MSVPYPSDLEILKRYGKEDLAILYIGKFEEKILEFVESVQPPIPREKKWVIILSTLYGCPISCKMCDAGEYYYGPVSKEGMLAQILHILDRRFPDRHIPIPKLKIQFARMGEPSLNPDVLTLLEELPSILDSPGLLPCVSTVAPNGARPFFDRLIPIKNNFYPKGQFQLQFSLHSTDQDTRRDLIAHNIWSFDEIAEYGERWFRQGDRKITLNFIVGKENVIDPRIIASKFNPERYFIKLTPVNPTHKALQNSMESEITKENYRNMPLAAEFRALGYETMVSIGDWEENQIGSNCGQFATQFLKGAVKLKENYCCEDYLLE